MMLAKLIKLLLLIFASILFGFIISSISLLAQVLIGIDFKKDFNICKLLLFFFIVGYIPVDMWLSKHK